MILVDVNLLKTDPGRSSDWSRCEGTLRDLLLRTGVKGRLVTDAHLAALAIEHDATLLTRDGDFAQFPRLRVINPLR